MVNESQLTAALPWPVWLLNFVLYQSAWFGCVLGGVGGWPDIGVGIAIGTTLLHILLAPEWRREAAVVMVCGVYGWGIDSLQLHAGVFSFPTASGSGLPLWYIALWPSFGITLHYAFAKMRGRYALITVLGAIGGPLAFRGGESLGAIVIEAPRLMHLGVLGGVWALSLPLLTWVAHGLLPLQHPPRYGRAPRGI